MRSWELPATATATVASDSEFHRQLYGAEGAVLFTSTAALRQAVDRLLADDELRARVAAAGREAVAAGTYQARVKLLVGSV
jgi:uroporphyrinogen-III synthase